jgi:hypothetical protein
MHHIKARPYLIRLQAELPLSIEKSAPRQNTAAAASLAITKIQLNTSISSSTRYYAKSATRLAVFLEIFCKVLRKKSSAYNVPVELWIIVNGMKQ